MNMENVTPFSNGSEATNWLAHNCELCTKGMKFDWRNPPDYEETQSLVNEEKECGLKFALEYGFVSGNISMADAVEIGWTKDSGIPAKCEKFSPELGLGCGKNQLRLDL